MHPEDGTVIIGGNVTGGKQMSFAVPFMGPAVLYIRSV
jgi:hypothetical protein